MNGVVTFRGRARGGISRGATALIVTVLTFGSLLAAGERANAKVPGRNGRIVFGRFDPAVGDQVVYVVNPDGSGLRRISHGPAEVPRWSPDGTRIATAGSIIYEVDGSGSTVLPVPPGFDPNASIFGCNVWTPGGGRLACEVLAFDHPGRNGIYIRRSSDGGHLVRLTRNPGGDDVPGDYSPDGRRLAFIRNDPTRPAGADTALFVVRRDGNGLRRLTSWGPFHDPTASWSPNGRWILFDVRDRIFAIHPDGSGRRPVRLDVDANWYTALYPVWSPDGTKIVFSLDTASRHALDIYTMRANGSHLRRLTTALPGAIDLGEGDEFPDWGVAVAGSP